MAGPKAYRQSRWKRQELRIARLLGGNRVKAPGKEVPDVARSDMAVEVKDRAELPKWIVEAVNHIRTLAEKHQLPLVTLTSPQSRQVLVVMDLRDFKEWFGPVDGPKKEASDG